MHSLALISIVLTLAHEPTPTWQQQALARRDRLEAAQCLTMVESSVFGSLSTAVSCSLISLGEQRPNCVVATVGSRL